MIPQSEQVFGAQTSQSQPSGHAEQTTRPWVRRTVHPSPLCQPEPPLPSGGHTYLCAKASTPPSPFLSEEPGAQLPHKGDKAPNRAHLGDVALKSLTFTSDRKPDKQEAHALHLQKLLWNWVLLGKDPPTHTPTMSYSKKGNSSNLQVSVSSYRPRGHLPELPICAPHSSLPLLACSL